MPITTSSPFVTEELVFYDDFSTYSLGGFTGGGVYTFGVPLPGPPWGIGTQSWTIESGNILRGTMTSLGTDGFKIPVFFKNGRVRIKARRRQTASFPDPDNEQIAIWMRNATIAGRLIGADVGGPGGPAGVVGNGITSAISIYESITFTPSVWYILELEVRGPNFTISQYSEGEVLLESVTGLHGEASDPGDVYFGVGYETDGSIDFDWIEVYKLPY